MKADRLGILSSLFISGNLFINQSITNVKYLCLFYSENLTYILKAILVKAVFIKAAYR